VLEVAHVRKRNPLSDLDKGLQDSRYPRHNHLCKCWWPSVKGFRGSGGSNFALPYSLWSSSLQHSCTTVRLCDECITSVLTIVFWDPSRSKPDTLGVSRLVFSKLFSKKKPLGFSCNLWLIHFQEQAVSERSAGWATTTGTPSLWSSNKDDDFVYCVYLLTCA